MTNDHPQTSPVASIVVTVCDRQELGHRAVRSALAQTEAAVEVVVVDDASHEPFRFPGDDERIRVLRLDQRGGVCRARNAGLRAAAGEWVTFLDDDDELDPRMIERSVSAARSSAFPAPVAVMSAVLWANGTGRPEVRVPVSMPRGGSEPVDAVRREPRQTFNTLVMPTVTLRELGGWDEGIAAWEHQDLFLRVAQACSIQAVGEPTYRMLEHGGLRNRENWLAMARGMDRTLAKHRPLFERRPEALAHHLSTMGLTYLRAGRWGAAIEATTKGLVADPTRGRHYVWWGAALLGPRVFEWVRNIRHVPARTDEI
jgi:glycosyltransferase involved in cell wall biosynthesis